ncbi:hypothetical protein SAMN04487969_101167 [Paenibacillus algorifonticola]|uniref:Uncharacterized protein n=1 Tax=Paenibacillus algorifonticola TaxID=684063 RepID=A0A1I1XXY6_9BACL|nr:hypothetical protein SAMN04487969_101167 [Paenibacillus algorifonticola]
MGMVRQAIEWANKRSMVGLEKKGLGWGDSWAGWVIPKFAGKDSLVFSIPVSSGINWRTQGEYNTRICKNGSNI